MACCQNVCPRNDDEDAFRWGPAFWRHCLRFLRKIVRKNTENLNSCQDLVRNKRPQGFTVFGRQAPDHFISGQSQWADLVILVPKSNARRRTCRNLRLPMGFLWASYNHSIMQLDTPVDCWHNNHDNQWLSTRVSSANDQVRERGIVSHEWGIVRV